MVADFVRGILSVCFFVIVVCITLMTIGGAILVYQATQGG